MEKDAEAVLDLFRQGFSQPNEQKSLQCILQAIKVISTALPFSTHDHITCHPEIIKMLVISSPVNKQSILFLLEALISKFKNKQYVIFSVWKIFQSVAQLQPKTASTILIRKVIDFDPDPRKKPNKVTKTQQQYISINIGEIKRTVLKLIPQLFEIVFQRSPMELKEKLLIFKLFRMECKDPELLMEISRTAEEMKQRYSAERESRRPVRAVDLRSQRRKATTRKILPPPSKFSVDKVLMEEHIFNKSQELLPILKTEANVEALISFAVHPNAHPLEEKVWSKAADTEKAQQLLRKQRVLDIFQDYKYFRRIVATCPQLFNIFFNYIDTHNVHDLNFQGVQSLILIFLREQPPIVTMLLMKSSILQSFYPFCEDSLVYEFILRVAGMTNFKSTLGTQLKQIHYAYLKAVDFFPVMVNNLCRVKHDKLTALKPKDILDLEAMLKRYYAEKKKHPIASGQQQHTGISRNSSLYKYRQNKTKFFQIDRVSFFSAPPSSKKIAVQTPPIRAPFALKQWKGYYSTAPVLNFFNVQQQKINLDNQQWHHMNCKLYYDILRSTTLLKTTPLCTPDQLLTTIVPDKPCLQQLFLLLKKYTYLHKLNPHSNSSITTIKILNTILETSQFDNYKTLSRYCREHVHLLYPIICMLFNTEKKATRLQGLMVVKTLGQNVLEIVRLFWNFVGRVEERASVLEEVQEDVWYIMMLWMFDCMLNNIYQTMFYDIFALLFTYGREPLLIKILFKYNMVSCLHNAHEDIVKNKVLIVGWHIHSFYMHIRKIYFLIRMTYEKRTELSILKTNLNKLVAWNILSSKMSSRGTRLEPGSLDDLSRSIYSNCSLISQ